MTYTVFSQAPEDRGIVELVTTAAARFDVVVTAAGAGDTLRAAARGAQGEFRVSARATTDEDLVRAQAAEAAGRSAGMAALAARCSTVWTLDPEGDVPEWLALELCAVLAFAALGPVLPADGSALLGVRSAQARAGALRPVT